MELNVSNNAMRICTETVRQMAFPASTKLLRFVKSGNKLSIHFEVPRSDDQIVRDEGLAVFAVPSAIAAELSGMTLDVNDDGCLVLS